jgi:hypothetical protein
MRHFCALSHKVAKARAASVTITDSFADSLVTQIAKVNKFQSLKAVFTLLKFCGKNADDNDSGP